MERQTPLQVQVAHTTSATGVQTRPIRITFVEPSLGAYRVPLFRGLAARPGIDLALLYAQSGRPNAVADGFRATQVERKTYQVLGAPIYWQQSQLDAVDRSKTDVVCFDWDVHYASLVPALLKAKRQGVATMLFGHGTSKNDGTWKAAPRHGLATLADVLVTYSHGARQAYIDRGWSADRVFAAPNALDLDAIDSARKRALADPAALSIFKTKHRLHTGSVVLFVSRLDRLRRVDLLLEAIRSLDVQGLRLAIVGDGPAKGDLEHLAQTLGMTDRVLFAGPVYDEAELAKWFSIADVFAFPSYMGLSAIHSLAYGLPVVTGNDRWAHGPEVEAVIHEQTGLYFAHNDSKAMAAAIRRLIEDSSLRAKLGRQGDLFVRERYSMSAMIDAFEAAIRSAARRAIE